MSTFHFKPLFRLWSILLFCQSTTMAFAQNVAINNTGTQPHASAMLDISSTTKGILVPRMTTEQRIAITTPAKGLMVFDTNTNSFWFHNGTMWNGLSTATTLTLPMQQTINSNLNGIDITNLSGGALRGVSNLSNGIGVFGESANGNGVKGYSSNAGSAAVFGSSLAGIGVKAFSFTGTALEVNGKVKISGGNTNPSNGAVLTSDAAGNAVWKNTKVAFLAKNDEHNQAQGTISHNNTATLSFSNEEYDYTNNYSSGVFTAPIAGLYHFSALIVFSMYDLNDNIDFTNLSFKVTHDGTSAYKGRSVEMYNKNSTSSWSDATITVDIKLAAGDTVSLTGLQRNSASSSVSWYGKFFGHLVFAD